MCDRGRGATIYRNYFVPLAGGVGQTAQRQLNGLALLGEALSEALGKPVDVFWQMRNGYALCNQAGLEAISAYLVSLRSDELDALRGKLCVSVHTDVEVTDAPGENRPAVSQAFCSALPSPTQKCPLVIGERSHRWCWRRPMKRQCGARF
jgi:hypothetical protein